MGQSLINTYLHIIFSTKYRKPMITDDIENELYNYIGGICKNLDCQPIKVGGYIDHIHILCRLSNKITIANLLQEVKSNSSKWIKTKGIQHKNFYWQNGYGAFSVNPSQINTVINYISNQKTHHKRKSFQKEYLALLKKYQIEYDERYMWD